MGVVDFGQVEANFSVEMALRIAISRHALAITYIPVRMETDTRIEYGLR